MSASRMLQIQYIESGGGGDHLCSKGHGGRGESVPGQCGGLDGWQRETLIGFDGGGAFTCVPARQQLPVRAARGPILISHINLLIASDCGRNLIHLLLRGRRKAGGVLRHKCTRRPSLFFKMVDSGKTGGGDSGSEAFGGSQYTVWGLE